ncbi:MAG: nucleoside monophosphate kinase [Candidatus Levyibacteriota bacterium]
MKLILIGIQGAGKSTQGNLLSEKFGIPYLSTGHIFRELAKEKTPLGRYIKEVMNAGYLISDDKTLEIVTEYLHRPEYKNGYILDGFPRTTTQAEAFENGIDKVIYLKVSDREALWRLSYREPGDRQDETLSAIRKRIEQFNQLTKPVLDFYRERRRLIEINGENSIEEVFQDILNGIGQSEQ